jgi:hypothetical protein
VLNTEQNLNIVKEQIENLKDILVKEDEKITSTDTRLIATMSLINSMILKNDIQRKEKALKWTY